MIQNRTVCDLTGDEAVAERVFSVDGKAYHLDLSESAAATFDEALSRFVAVASPAKGRENRAKRQEEVQQVREWAEQNGYEVKPKGRIKQEVWDAYDAAGEQ